jgi:hypothetical protein
MHQHEADALFDALGFSGEYREYDEIDTMIAMRDYLLANQPPQAEGGDIERTVIAVCRTLRDTHEYSDDDRASAALGWTIGRKIATDTEASVVEGKALVDRSLQNVRIRQDSLGQGSLDLFYGGFLEAACTQAYVAPDWQQKHIRQIVAYTAHRQYDIRRRERIAGRPSMWPHLLRGLAPIAMVQGYYVQPPADQRDENGAWQLPHEREEDDDA